jgi:hypothetical protein
MISSINRERRSLLEAVVELIEMEFLGMRFLMQQQQQVRGRPGRWYGMPSAEPPLGRADSAVGADLAAIACSDVAELMVNSHAALPLSSPRVNMHSCRDACQLLGVCCEPDFCHPQWEWRELS